MTPILQTKTQDNLLIIYPLFAGFGLLALYVFLMEYLKLGFMPAGLILVLVYLVFFDVNHYFPTYFRVFLDKAYFEQHKKWLIPSTFFVLFAALLVCWAVSRKEPQYEVFLYLQFFKRFVLLLGFYHLVKQNWGFMAIYKRQAKEKETSINWNLLALISGCFIPVVLFSLINPIWFPSTEKYLFSPIPEQKEFVIAFWHKLAYANLILCVLFAGMALAVKQFQIALPAKSLAMYCLAVAMLIFAILSYGANKVLICILIFLLIVFAVSLMQSVRYQLKEPSLNMRKWMVFLSSLILYFGVLLYPVDGDKFILVAAVTLPHNIQYLAFVPQFSRKQYAHSRNDHGLAKKIANKTMILFFCGVVFAAIFEFGRTGSGYFLPQDWYMTKNMIVIFFLSLVLHHYYLDAVIWKFDKEKELNAGL